MQLPTFEDVLAAAERIRPHIHRTPVMTSSAIDEMAGASLFFKCENLQKVGAFKIRGATNAVFALDDESAARGVVTHSSGNHAAALALAARKRGIPARVVMPRTAPSVKVKAVEGYGAEITFCEPVSEAREAACAEIAERTGSVVIPPFDHPHVIAGQGTAALELHDEYPDLDCVITPCGGGGLLSGTALAYETLAPATKVMGAEPLAANTATRSLTNGAPVAAGNPTTVCDGLRTSLGQLTYRIVERAVSDVFAIDEGDVICSMRLVWERMKLIIEASCAVALAAVLKNPDRFADRRVGIVLTGGNVDLDRLPWVV